MSVHGRVARAALCGLCLSVAGCGGSTSEQTATWRADCPPSHGRRRSAWTRRATRDAWPMRRHELRLREAAAPGLVPARDARRARPEAHRRRARCAWPRSPISASCSSSTSTTSPTASAAATRRRRRAGPFRRVHAGALRRSGDHLLSLVPLGRRPERRRRRDRQRVPRRATASARRAATRATRRRWWRSASCRRWRAR